MKYYKLCVIKNTLGENAEEYIADVKKDPRVLRAEVGGEYTDGGVDIDIDYMMKEKTIEEAKKKAPQLAYDLADTEIFTVLFVEETILFTEEDEEDYICNDCGSEDPNHNCINKK